MIDQLELLLSGFAGIGLGVIFYGGLYITVSRGLLSQHPFLWFSSSLLLRGSLVLTGLYFVSNGEWQRIVACMAGFVVTGLAFQFWQATPSSIEKAPVQSSGHTSDEIHHAP